MILLLTFLLQQPGAVSHNDRSLTLTCMPGRIRLAYHVRYGDQSAQPERRKMDADGDGQISPQEAQAFAQSLAAILERTLALEIDQQRVRPRFESQEVALGSDQGVHPVSFSVRLGAGFTILGGREHRVQLDDRFELTRLGETEIVIEESPGTRVTGSWSGRQGSGMHGLKWTWHGPRGSEREDRSIGFRWVQFGGSAAQASRPLRLRGALVMGLLSIVVGVGVGFWLLHKSKRGRGRMPSL